MDSYILNEEDSKYFYTTYEEKKENNKSSNILNKYEKTKVIYERINLINNGAIPLIENFEKYNNIYDIVLEELNQKKIPFIIKRTIGNINEYWKLEDLLIV